ncbi:hypothetical protein KAFR_0C00200 [Kazachstania africana CBS 2517]|uniref:Uncharacterized protein n=1 Tax=Kazachstania africana (strain ATCC 22294 / BCRC 22015 / CBS 2517 / CECT 1963 / NBRC 1671 / NRRL Y-8276) TaxID=1071382 RepID=H2ARL6_KAZAF|nr:hypothetical protein KAFR_0C00200 [Kazachstania africana CBS 2517]CCF57016.1 hypothetical protein KAFR_0C00200 [Kazachstania africana CBS 2517]
MATTNPIIARLVNRVNRIESFLGDYDGSENILEKTTLLLDILQGIYERGSNYNKNLFDLLHVFVSTNDFDERTEVETVIKLQQDEFVKLSSTLENLKLAYDKHFKFDAIIELPKKTIKFDLECLDQLPILILQCNELIIKSLAMSEKFLDYIITCNDKFRSVKSKLDRLEEQIDSIG